MSSKARIHFRMERSDSNLVTVWIDVAKRSMNVFHSSVIDELEDLIAELEADSAKAIVFRSAKASGFFAGADVNQIAELNGREEVEAVVRRGQGLFARVESLPMPTIAAIHGPCLGGGLEFALACDHRIALNTASTKLGLPEVQLGLIPGWGGTQRLPRLIGAVHALPMILLGKKLSAAKAAKAGLVDLVADEAQWEDVIHTFAESNREQRPAAQGITRSIMNSGFGRWFVFRSASNQIAKDARNYPALPAALRAIRAGYSGNGDGYAVERTEFANLIETRTCRNLLSLFQWREQARSSQRMAAAIDDRGALRDLTINRMSSDVLPHAAETSSYECRTIGIVGAGAMGAGIGQLAALKGYNVVLKELNCEMAEAGYQRVADLMNNMVAKKRLSSNERDVAMGQVSTTDSFDDLADCDFVIEAVVEKLEVKKAVLASLAVVLKPHAIIASNTSALSVAAMATSTSCGDRVAGLHFFNPVHRMDLVEIVRTTATSQETVVNLLKIVNRLGKTPIVTSDSPGFLVNRVLFPYIGEAVRMVMEGYDCLQLDREVKKFGMPMGPIELIDHVGIDVAWHVATTLEEVLPESEGMIRLLGQMVARGWSGKKSGQGFYHYVAGKRGPTANIGSAVDIGSAADIAAGRDRPDDLPTSDTEGVYLNDGMTDIQRRLIYPMINEVGFCMQEGVVEEAWMADLAMILGTGFAPFRGGPMTLATAIGHCTVLNNLHVLTVRYGERFKPSAWLVDNGAERSAVACEMERGLLR